MPGSVPDIPKTLCKNTKQFKGTGTDVIEEEGCARFLLKLKLQKVNVKLKNCVYDFLVIANAKREMEIHNAININHIRRKFILIRCSGSSQDKPQKLKKHHAHAGVVHVEHLKK